jgi:hypothetical protein
MVLFVWLGLAAENLDTLTSCHTIISRAITRNSTMKKIDISTPKHQNTFALVDDSDCEELSKHNWRANEYRGKFYAIRNIRVDGKWTSIRMHTAIMGNRAKKEIDHRNGDGLDNQRHNLRHCTNTENQRNRGVQKNNISGFKGVSWANRDKKWRVSMRYKGKSLHLGFFFCVVKAAKAYDMAAKEYHGEFARLNFPESNKENSNAV